MNKKLLKIIRLIALLSSIIMVLLISIFFIGEGVINTINSIKGNEIILFIFMPGTLFIGVFIAWWKDLIGGIIICSSIILFNVIDMILFNKNIISFNFLLCFLIGVLFIVVGLSNKKKKDK